MTEAELQAAVVELLNLTGWHHLHIRRSIGKGHRWTTTTSVTGWPDLYCWHPRQRRTLALELKTATGRLTPEQRLVLDSLAAAGVETAVIRPADLQDLARRLRTTAAA